MKYQVNLWFCLTGVTNECLHERTDESPLISFVNRIAAKKLPMKVFLVESEFIIVIIIVIYGGECK